MLLILTIVLSVLDEKKTAVPTRIIGDYLVRSDDVR
jgi:hypothetical protein